MDVCTITFCWERNHHNTIISVELTYGSHRRQYICDKPTIIHVIRLMYESIKVKKLTFWDILLSCSGWVYWWDNKLRRVYSRYSRILLVSIVIESACFESKRNVCRGRFSMKMRGRQTSNMIKSRIFIKAIFSSLQIALCIISIVLS